MAYMTVLELSSINPKFVLVPAC